jgi:hypothetical protein
MSFWSEQRLVINKLKSKTNFVEARNQLFSVKLSFKSNKIMQIEAL